MFGLRFNEVDATACRSALFPPLAGVALALGLVACGSPPPAATTPVAAPVVAPAPAAAAPDFASMRGARAGQAEMGMERMGFTNVRQRGLTAYWLHAASNTCVRVVTSQGRYQTVDQVAPANCGR